ncbi:MAG: serine/threonine-protein kinase, partial [Thermoguttaceae bacterium]
MTVGTTQALLELLAKSELLSPEQLTECQETALLAEDVRAFVRILIEKGLITRWQAAQLLAGRSSFFLGKYKLIELLGRGGMGGVFVAEHTTMNRRVALKIISKELGRDPASLERFLVEARAGAALDHPNIVHSYSVDNEGDRYYMVMEFVEGKDLQRMVEDDGPLDFERAVDYMRQAADGLAHAHSRKMIHCDIKPANLIVNQQGVVNILDMGMARLMGHDDESNGHDDKANGHDDRVLGTVDYLAPEQALGSPDLDHRVDIYSLGCTFYFLLTGQPPFPEGTLAQRIVKHQTQEPRSILELRPTTPRDLVKLCQKMMAKDPEKRIQSAAEISQWLAAWHPPKQKLVRAVPLEEEAEKPADALESLAAAVAVAEQPSLPEATGTPLESSKGLRFTPRQQLLLYSGITGGVVLLLLVVL